MAIDEKYSMNAFQSKQQTGGDLKRLSDMLMTEVLQEIHVAVEPAIEVIVNRLNALGHQLKPYTPSTPGDVQYRDDEIIDGKYVCRLRLGVDVVVSIGFADTRNASEPDE